MAYMCFGKSVEDWEDIYALLKFKGKQPRSLADLMDYKTPDTLQGCVKIAFELTEAKSSLKDNPVRAWIHNMLKQGCL